MRCPAAPVSSRGRGRLPRGSPLRSGRPCSRTRPGIQAPQGGSSAQRPPEVRRVRTSAFPGRSPFPRSRQSPSVASSLALHLSKNVFLLAAFLRSVSSRRRTPRERSPVSVLKTPPGGRPAPTASDARCESPQSLKNDVTSPLGFSSASRPFCLRFSKLYHDASR